MFGVKLISVVNGLGSVVTVLFWGLVFTRLPSPNTLDLQIDRMNIATTYGFMIGDIIWALPLLMFACVGVWRYRLWGWLIAQLVNVLWVYSVTVVLTRDLFSGGVSPGTVVFLPFALFSLWASMYLWNKRSLFF